MTQQVQNVIQQIDNVLPGIQINWIVQGLEEEKKQLLERNKRFGIWKQPTEWRGKWLDALCYIDRLSGNVVTMRACSVKLYSDSKYFEREIKKHLLYGFENMNQFCVKQKSWRNGRFYHMLES